MIFTDPHESRALARLHHVTVVPGRPRRQPTPEEPSVTQLDTARYPRTTPTDASKEHRARLAVALGVPDKAAAREVLKMLGLVDEDGQVSTPERFVGELSQGIRG